MEERTAQAVADALADYDRVVEVGIGDATAVAERLAARGTAVTATDVVPRAVPDPVAFVVDDVTDPDRSVYREAGAVYGLNLPPELHRPARSVAREAGADFLFTTLGGDPPAVQATLEPLPAGTLYRADAGR